MNGIRDILKQMTLEEKIELCEGKNFWTTRAFEKYGIPSLFMCDGPHGLRKQENAGDMLGVNVSRPATCFPAAVTTGASWDTDLLFEIGKSIAQEAKDQDVGLVLGPGVNLKRNPRCGRNFEYFSEDPFLAGKLAASFIRGVEGEGIGSSLKHFAANSQETNRFTSDSIMDERTLKELYLAAFETAVKEGNPSTIMCAYPKLNGIHCSDHKELLDTILRKEWGYSGLVVTDWGAMNDRIRAFESGCDLNMPGGSDYMKKETVKAVRNGTLPEEKIDACAERVLRLVFRAEETKKTKAPADYDAHYALAKKAAEQGAVLLKNEGGMFPVSDTAKVLIVGNMAKEPRYQGSGSSHINPVRLSCPLDYFPGAAYVSGCDARGDTTEKMLDEIKAAAKDADTVLVFAGLPDRYESEGFDRDSLKMPEGQVQMIEAAAEANPNTAVLLLTGSVVEVPWEDSVRAVLYMGLMGEAGGEAVADLVYGRANPCGKLTESWPQKEEDCPSASYYAEGADALYREGIYVGYRYYDKAKKEVRYPFGYGLSYTTFAYSGLNISGNTVSVSVTNTGTVPGAEIVQLYIEAPQNGIHRPLRELKGFRKVFLEPGQTETVSFTLTDRSFAVWQDGWKVPEGTYTVCVGSSSRDLPLKTIVYQKGEPVKVPAWQEGSWQQTLIGIPSVEELEQMTGRPYVPVKAEKGSFTMDSTVAEMKEHSRIMNVMYRTIEKTIAKDFGGTPDYENPEFRMMMESAGGAPLRCSQISGGIKGGIMPGMLLMANGHFFKGLLKMIFN